MKGIIVHRLIKHKGNIGKFTETKHDKLEKIKQEERQMKGIIVHG